MKKIIHTYVNQRKADIGARENWFTFNNKKEPSIEKHQLLGMLLSAHFAKKHYKNITLYSTLDIINLVSEIGIPYTGFVRLDDNIKSTFGPFSLGKMLVYQMQDKPFIHIDYDTFLVNKLNEKIASKPFAFSHEDLKDFDHSIKTIRGLVPAYIDWLNLFDDDVPEWWCEGEFITIDEIPNMNVTSINDIETFKKVALEPILKHYYENRETWDQGNNACVLEQLLTYAHLKNSGYKVDYFLPKNPTLLSYGPEGAKNYKEPFNEETFLTHKSYHHVFSHHLCSGLIQQILTGVAKKLGYSKQIDKIELLFN